MKNDSADIAQDLQSPRSVAHWGLAALLMWAILTQTASVAAAGAIGLASWIAVHAAAPPGMLGTRRPVAHAAATGKGVKVAVISLAEDKRVLSLLQEVAPNAEVMGRLCRSDDLDEDQIAAWLKQEGCRVAVVPEVPRWPRAAAARDVVDHGAVLSWFHYPTVHPGLIRSRFVYWSATGAPLGFADRFLTDPPGFHPVEIEAGLSGTAPQAAGLAALVKSVNPELTPPQVEELMVQNATPLGVGVLVPDAHKAVVAMKKPSSIPPDKPFLPGI